MVISSLLVLVLSAACVTAGEEGDGKPSCLNNCSGRGRCLNGICICEGEYAGEDCSKIIDRNVPDTFPSMTDAVSGWEEGRGPSPAGTESLKICIVTTEIAGPVSNGGIGTAYTTLAKALAGTGHQVTVLFTKGTISMFGPFEDHVKAYNKLNITLVGLHRTGQKYIPRHLQASYEVYRYMLSHEFDVVHLHDYEGAGYYSLIGKDQGKPELLTKMFVIGLHGPNLWAKSVGNMEQIDKIDDLEMDFMERRCVKLSDVVISPSQYLLGWMGSEGWPINKRSLCQPNLLPYQEDKYDNEKRGVLRAVTPIRELVFFGRLETRKGIVTFCDAVDHILENAKELGVVVGKGGLEKLIFLGRSALVDGVYGMHYVQKRAQKWNIPWKVISRMNSTEALGFLGQGERLAVMPSRIENSPYTIYECAHARIPFVATDVGGIPDLVHKDDHGLALFEPTKDALVAKLVQVLRGGIRPARPSIDAEENERVWLKWHQSLAKEHRQTLRALQTRPVESEEDLPFVSVIMTHFNRGKLVAQAIESVELQDYPRSRYELIVMDDGSTDEQAKRDLKTYEAEFDKRGWKIVWGENCYLGCARNKAVGYAKGKYILFMDDDNVAKPHEVRTFVRAMESSNADVLTSFVDFFWGMDRPVPKRRGDRASYIFLGGSPDVGAFKNCYGDANCFVRVSSFKDIGGYTEDYGIGFEDWEMYANASLRGFKVDVLPDAVYHYRFTPNSMQKTTDFFKNRRRSLRPYLNSLPRELHDTLLGAVFPRNADGSIAAPTGLAAQGTSRFFGATKSDGTPLSSGSGSAQSNLLKDEL
ncbi:glycosyltransferase [Chloropicon primus]|nr:glycosyltransferase [Chloropicon primus]